MKKLNNKGIGHHLLLLAVAVMAVVGASGYFVWQRQQNSNIDAKAAGYTYQVVTGANMGDAFTGSTVKFKACSQLLKGKTYVLNVMLEASTKQPVNAYVKSNNKTILSLKLSSQAIVTGTKNLSGDASVLFGDVDGLFTPQIFTVKNMMPCNQTDIANKYNYQYVSWSSGASQGVPDPNSKVAMFACTLLNADGTYTLETKLTGTPEYAAYSSAQDFNAVKKDLVNLFKPGNDFFPSYGWPRPVIKKGTQIAFGGNYLDLYESWPGVKLYGMASPITVENIKSCR